MAWQKRFLCDVCGETLVAQNTLHRHVERKHTFQVRKVSVREEIITFQSSASAASTSEEGLPSLLDSGVGVSLFPDQDVRHTVGYLRTLESDIFPDSWMDDVGTDRDICVPPTSSLISGNDVFLRVNEAPGSDNVSGFSDLNAPFLMSDDNFRLSEEPLDFDFFCGMT